MSTLQKLFRPVGLTELELILDTNSTQFPPRLAWQPIFYPVLNEAYAAQIADSWNTKDEFSGYCGFVTAFELEKTYLSKFKVENVGGAMHNELWVPSEELSTFNDNIVHPIQVIDAFYGENYKGILKNTQAFKNLTVQEQLEKVKALLSDKTALKSCMQTECNAFLANIRFWRDNGLVESDLVNLCGVWGEVFGDLLLV